MSGDRRPTMPPVRLPSEAELARDALAVPLFSRAARLARWTADGIRVGAGGELLIDQLTDAVRELGLLEEEEATVHAAEAWRLAIDLALIEIEEDPGAEALLQTDEPVATAKSGEELVRLTGGTPADVLGIWQDGVESVLADAAMPVFEDLLEGPDSLLDDLPDPDGVDLDALDWDPEEEAEFLDGALRSLYNITASDTGVASGAMVPLPVLAASLVVPDDMDDPTDDVLEEVSMAMMKLDDQFRLLELIGLVEYRPVDETLIEEAVEASEPAGGAPAGEPLDEEEVTRYGMVRLTALGVHGVRTRLLAAGTDAPLVGELAGENAEALLDALPGHTEDAARAEVELWLERRVPLEAARDLLAAARGDDPSAPQRRLFCQQALSLTGEEAEPALREVLEDRQLGGLARVWLTERGAVNVPPPTEEMVFWLTVDTLAAQLSADHDSPELRGLMQGLVDQHTGFFDKAWRVDHPATGEVLEAMGRVHPDKRAAKEARKAAFKARSHAAG